MRQPRAPSVVPDRQEVRAALVEMEAHPEFVLSRREIIKFILAEPRERSELVQAAAPARRARRSASDA